MRTEWAEQKNYPELNLHTEPRDMLAEKLMEDVDSNWYGTADQLQRLLETYSEEELLDFATGGKLTRR